MEYSTLIVHIYTQHGDTIFKKYYFVLVRLNGFTMSSLVCWDDHISILAYLLHEDPLAMHVLCKYYNNNIASQNAPQTLFCCNPGTKVDPLTPLHDSPACHFPPSCMAHYLASGMYLCHHTMPCHVTGQMKCRVTRFILRSLQIAGVCVDDNMYSITGHATPDHCKIKGF